MSFTDSSNKVYDNMVREAQNIIVEALKPKKNNNNQGSPFQQLSLFNDDEMPQAEEPQSQTAQPAPEPEKKTRKRTAPLSKNYSPEDVIKGVCAALKRQGVQPTLVDDLMYVYATFTGDMYPNPNKHKQLNTPFLIALDEYRRM